MSAHVFASAAVACLAGTTCMNILISLIQLCVEEHKKCSIIGKTETDKKAFMSAGKKQKKYAVLHMAEKTA